LERVDGTDSENVLDDSSFGLIELGGVKGDGRFYVARV
jgi:hypothetical protein